MIPRTPIYTLFPYTTLFRSLKGLDENLEQYERLLKVFAAQNIGYFFYNGGGDSQDTAHKISDRKSTRLNSSHTVISYAVFCLKKKKIRRTTNNSQDHE